jgi:hypothetical protein
MLEQFMQLLAHLFKMQQAQQQPGQQPPGQMNTPVQPGMPTGGQLPSPDEIARIEAMKRMQMEAAGMEAPQGYISKSGR